VRFGFYLHSYKINGNARLYAVGRGISASYEFFKPSAADWGARNLQYAMEPRLPYTALLATVFLIFH
jgi:hypothetical protein